MGGNTDATDAGYEEDGGVYGAIAIDTMNAVLDALMDSEKSLLASEFKKVVTDSSASGHLRETIPYLYVGAFLSMSGQEISPENLSKVIKAIGMEPNADAEAILVKNGLKTHLPYLYAYYFLLALGRESTEEEVLSVAKSIGIEPDRNRVKEVLEFLSSKNAALEEGQ